MFPYRALVHTTVGFTILDSVDCISDFSINDALAW